MKTEFRGQTDNGEYAYGDLIEGKYIFTGRSEDGELMLCKINPNTLSLHFEDMLDSQGNRIFASLSEDGKGGSLIEGDSGTKHFSFTMEDIYLYKKNYSICKVIGIQE